MSLVVIGSKQSRDSGSVLSGDAYVSGTATADYSDNFFDIGFMPKEIDINNKSSNELSIKFLHQEIVDETKRYEDPEAPENSVTPSSTLSGNESKVWRDRNHRFVAVKGSGAFQIEAW